MLSQRQPARPATYQVAAKLDAATFAALKRLSAATGKTYAAVIADALAALESAASPPLAETSAPTLYALLPDAQRRPWKQKIRDLRASGESFATIGKRMFRDHRLAGADGLPLSASTIRGICAR